MRRSGALGSPGFVGRDAELDDLGRWSRLPNASTALYRAGTACGIYRIGGSDDVNPQTSAEVLAGHDSCGLGVSWVSESATTFTLQPGQQAQMVVTIDGTGLAQPGDYTAGLGLDTDTPYTLPAIAVTLHLTPPATWGKVSGVVTDVHTGAPLAGATVQIGTIGGEGATSYTLTTDPGGKYQLWLDRADNPLQLIVAKDRYVPQARTVRLSATPVTSDFALAEQ